VHLLHRRPADARPTTLDGDRLRVSVPWVRMSR
jgi:hypothetical protein